MTNKPPKIPSEGWRKSYLWGPHSCFVWVVLWLFCVVLSWYIFGVAGRRSSGRRMTELLDRYGEEVSCDVRNDHIGTSGGHVRMPVQILLFFRWFLWHGHLWDLERTTAREGMASLQSPVHFMRYGKVQDVFVVFWGWRGRGRWGKHRRRWKSRRTRAVFGCYRLSAEFVKGSIFGLGCGGLGRQWGMLGLGLWRGGWLAIWNLRAWVWWRQFIKSLTFGHVHLWTLGGREIVCCVITTLSTLSLVLGIAQGVRIEEFPKNRKPRTSNGGLDSSVGHLSKPPVFPNHPVPGRNLLPPKMGLLGGRHVCPSTISNSATPSLVNHFEVQNDPSFLHFPGFDFTIQNADSFWERTDCRTGRKRTGGADCLVWAGQGPTCHAMAAVNVFLQFGLSGARLQFSVGRGGWGVGWCSRGRRKLGMLLRTSVLELRDSWGSLCNLCSWLNNWEK